MILQKPGMVKMPFFLNSAVAGVAKLRRSPEHQLVFNLCYSAVALMSTPLVMTLLVFMNFKAFITFIGAVVARTRL